MGQDRESNIFIYLEGASPKCVPAKAGETIAEIISRAGGALLPGTAVHVGQCVDSLKEPEDTLDGEDADDSVSADLRIESLHGAQHIHCHRCRRISVTVNYQSKEKHHRFSPSATLATVVAWARKKFKLTDVDADNLVLQICNTLNRPRLSLHLGELVKAPECKLCFDLVFEKKNEG